MIDLPKDALAIDWGAEKPIMAERGRSSEKKLRSKSRAFWAIHSFTTFTVPWTIQKRLVQWVPLAEELVTRGVAKNDNVLGFHPAEYRAYMGYAVA